MSLSNVIKQSHDAGTIAIADGTGTPLSVTARYDRADFTAQGIAQSMREIVAYVSRGKLQGLRKGAPKWVSGSFSVMVAEVSEASTGTIQDMIHGKGAFSSRVSTTASLGDVITLDITWTMEGTDFGDGADIVVKFKDCAIEWTIAEGEPNTCSFSFTCYGDITINGSTYIAAPRRS